MLLVLLTNKYLTFYVGCDRFIFLVMLTLSLYTTANGNLNICIPTSNNKNNIEENYSVIIKSLKEKLTRSLEDNSTMFYDHLDYDFQHAALSMKGELNNVTVENLNDFRLQFFHEINFTKNEIEIFNLTFTNISVVGESTMTGNIGELFDIWGAGHFWANVLNFSVSVTSQIPIANSTTVCLFLDVKVKLQEFKCWFSGLMDDDELEELINHTFQAIASEAVEIVWDENKDTIYDQIKKWINSMILGDSLVFSLNELAKSTDEVLNSN